MNAPAGVSPFCQDMAFKPGATFSRPGLTGVFTTPFGATTMTYTKSYVDAKGVIRNLYLDAAGNLWVENITTSAGTATMLAAVTPGSYAKSVTAFGREYIAISDGIHGSDVALQYDGTNLDRVTTDGPGAPPNVGSIILPAVPMLSAGAGSGLTVVSATTTSLVGSVYTRLTINVISGALALGPGNVVQITGNSNANLNLTFPIAFVPSDTQIIAYAVYDSFQTGTGGSTVGFAAYALSRANNIVTVNTDGPHGLKVGYQAQISGADATSVPVGGVVSIVINNTDSPGVATITLDMDHGLASGESILIKGVSSIIVASPIVAARRKGGIVTIISTGEHNLVPGSLVTLSGVGDASFNTTFQVLSVPDPNTFISSQAIDADVDSTGGNIHLSWPIPDTAQPTRYEVLDIPSARSFQVALNWSDGTWLDGHVYLPWDGTYYVSAVLSATQFQYRQAGPDATQTSAGSPVTALVTPHGQVAPGKHRLRVSFLTRNDYVTRPSPWVEFDANGGQYISVSNIPIGPPNTKARILEFTGSGGAYFFYIPTTPQESGQIVGTATQIDDNTTTAAILDFGDNTLFAALGVSIPGNNVAAQSILDSALGFAFFGTRLIAYGQRSTIQNLVNMGFDGGELPSNPTVPAGWTGTGTIVDGHFGKGVRAPSLSQTFYEDIDGAPIAFPVTKYIARAWMSGGGCTVTISSAVTGFTTSVSLTPGPGGWGQAQFALAMPATIPPDMKLTVTSMFIVDELSIIFADAPFVDKTYIGSYVNNPEAFDGVSGVFGVEDTRKIMTCEIIRGSLYTLTQDPAGRLHVTQNNGVTEPAGWSTNEIAANCGALSTFAATVSQADDATAGGGEEWFAWISATGARICGGNEALKISQEIQPDWDLINTGSYLTCWALNNPANRRIYFGLPKGNNLRSSPAALATAPNVIYHVDYKGLDSAAEIAAADPIRISARGEMAARELSRKWCPWNIPANGGSLIYRFAGGPLYEVFLVGNGGFPGTISGGCGNIFALCDGRLTDDCLGQIFPIYITYAFASVDLEQALQLGGQRHLLYYLQWAAAGQGRLRVTPLVNSITNPWPIKATVPLRADPLYDDEWGGGQASGQRVFLKFEGLPA